MSAALDRIEQRASAHANPETPCDLGDNGDPCLMCEENRVMARDVLALVNIARAAQCVVSNGARMPPTDPPLHPDELDALRAALSVVGETSGTKDTA